MYTVTIVTVCLNAEKTIERTIQSVLNQSYPDIEYIIIDGKSADNTLSIVDEYYIQVQNGNYPGKSMVVISEPDDGIYDAMNKGIKSASGKLIGVINSDDWYEMGSIEHIVNNLDENATNCLISGGMVVHTYSGFYFSDNYKSIEQIWEGMLFGHPTCFVTRDVYETIGLYNIEFSIAADYDFVIRCYLAGVKFYKTDTVIAHFSYGGVSTRNAIDCTVDSINVRLKYIDRSNNIRKIVMGCTERLSKDCLNDLTQDELKECLGASECVIFGAGKNGELLSRLMQSNSIKVNFCVDNYVTGNSFVFTPDRLREYFGVLLISVARYENQIKKQVEHINRNIKIITISELGMKAIDIVKSRNNRVQQCYMRLLKYNNS